MSSSTIEITYEPIDYRTLSKKEKVQYLLSRTRKPRLDTERRSSICDDDNNSDSESESESDSRPIREINLDKRSYYTTPISVLNSSPRELSNQRTHRLDAELRKLDEFWSFKPIPREAPQVIARKTFPLQSTSSSSSRSSSEVQFSSSPASSENGMSMKMPRRWWAYY